MKDILSKYFKTLYKCVKIIHERRVIMPRIDMIIDDMIDEIAYAKRTLILQNTFNKIRSSNLDKVKVFR